MNDTKKLSKVWGWRLADYQAMFDLTDADLKKNLLECYSGITSVNAELTQQGGHIVSVDPRFTLKSEPLKIEGEQLLEKLKHIFDEYTDQFNVTQFTKWSAEYLSVLNHYFEDQKKPGAAKRYFSEFLTEWTQHSFSFDFALASHALFQQMDTINTSYAITDEIKKMCALAREARIFPILNEHGEIANSLGTVMASLQQSGYGVEIRAVKFEFQRGGNALLRVWNNACRIP